MWSDRELEARATQILKEMYGEEAAFREGQYEAIAATMKNRRSLVIQKTGWGKSLVYFICCRLLKEGSNGVTIVVSPLLALMDNQLAAAEKIRLRCGILNSTVSVAEKAKTFQKLTEKELDILFITPEGLFKDDFQEIRPKISVGLFVVDEAHCISDWGHDFRLEYGKLNRVISALPSSVRVLGTTATANDRVVEDLKKQFGNNVYISRGTLLRNNLYIQVLKMKDRASRYAWMAENIPNLEGSGIVYCLTQRDCDYVTDYLIKNNIRADSYYSGKANAEEALKKFQNNELKVLVATIKLGMGYDKGDIAFIIHYQMPQNVVSYYQQIGRAGRNIPKAYTFLMMGQEDEEIIEYFIRTAFPSEKELCEVRDLVQEHDGIGAGQLLPFINAKKARMEKALNFLEHDGYLYFDNGYHSTPKPFRYDSAHYEEIKAIRYREMKDMQQLQETGCCYNRTIINSLDDHTLSDCGFCANCCGRLFPETVQASNLEKAQQYLESLQMLIKPRKKWAAIDDPGFKELSYKKIQYQNETGICLSKYGDPGYGALVRQGKYAKPPRFSEELVGKSARLLQQLIQDNSIQYITCVPSLRSDIVPEFTKRLADRLKLTFLELLEKTSAEPQKTMENSSFQCINALRSFRINDGVHIPEKLILVDDIVDSKWTLTVCGYLLRREGCTMVFPFALADSSQKED
ncbi:MAG: RecQ family ATP-dependent DNA helicase [Oscillospiraceae bacterium]|nr:RecQ family ATP-dependent DNA helicase [Oscillospiraceae bacterium]